MPPLLSALSAATRRITRCVLISPLFFAGLAACAEAPNDQRAEAGRAASGPGYTLSTDALGGYAPARGVRGELVALSQILPPAGEDGVIVGDVESQTGAALRVLDDALADAGLTRAHVVHLTVHVTVDEAGAIDAQGVARAWRRSFANAMQPAAPARTLVGVAALPGDGARVSLTALAERPAPASTESPTAP